MKAVNMAIFCGRKSSTLLILPARFPLNLIKNEDRHAPIFESIFRLPLDAIGTELAD